MDPNYAGAWAALSAAYDLKGGFLSIPELSHKAVQFAEKAVRLNPRLSHAHQFLGGAYSTLGRYDEAIASMKQAVRLEPNNAGAHGSLARAYWLGKGMIEEAIVELEQAAQAGQATPEFHCGSVGNPIAVMEDEHASAGQALRLLRRLTDGYRPPGDACEAYRALLSGLKELEADLHLHIHLENNVLFPRAAALEGSARLVSSPASG